MLSCRRRTAILLLAVLPAAPLAAQEQTAEAFLRAIYEPYETRNVRGLVVYEQAGVLFVPDLAAAIAGYDQRDRANPTSRFHWNPFTDDQLGAASDIAIKVIAGGDRATGHVTLTRADGLRVRGVFDLVRTPAGWRIANVTWGRDTRNAMSIRRLFALP